MAGQEVAEAWDWLLTHNLISPLPTNETWCFITRRGHEVAQADDGLRALHAGQRLAMELHPRIERAVGAEFVLGRFEMAAFAAMREIEIRVRELGGASSSDIGVALMQFHALRQPCDAAGAASCCPRRSSAAQLR